MKKILNEIVAVARDAVSIMLEAKTIEATKEAKTGHANFVTAYDKRVQEFLYERLALVMPDAVFIGEEEKVHAKLPEGYAFIIDPIDGTTNFMMGYNCSCISIALLKAGEPVIGVVYNPYVNEVYTAIKGMGAFLNDEPIHVREGSIEDSIVMVGTAPYYEEYFEDTFEKIYKVFHHCIDIRRSGSAAIDLCAVAAGRVGLYFEQLLQPWDYAAGSLIVKEAGGVYQSIDGSELQFEKQCGGVAGSKQIVEEYLAIIGAPAKGSKFNYELEKSRLLKLSQKMISYYAGDAKRIQHFIKVHSFASMIGKEEGMSPREQVILEAAAYVHDIGIKESERIYGDCTGKHQEELGPDIAKVMLTECGFDNTIIDRVLYLVAHHHTYDGIDGDDYQILVEADFLVNLFEDSANEDSIKAAYAKIFKTEAGKRMCREMFGVI